MQIEQPVIRGGGVDLEIPSVDQHSQRRVNRQRHAIDQAMRHLDRIDGEWPDLEALAGLDLVQFRIIQQAVLFQLPLNIGQREFSAVNRDVQLRQDPRQRPDVVLVAVRQHDGAHVLAVLQSSK